MKYTLTLLLILILSATLMAQNNSGAPKITKPDTVRAANSSAVQVRGVAPDASVQTPKVPVEYWLSASVLLFGLAIIIVEYLLIRSKQMDLENAMRYIVITLIVISALFLIAAGYGNDQIAPAFGLFGTLAGYLLGRTTSRNTETANDKK